MVVYWKLGFAESMTISLFALSVSDFCLLVLSALVAFFHIPRLVVLSNITTYYRAVVFYFCGTVRISFNRLSLWITALISFERCTSILLPSRVKHVLTPKKITSAIVFLSIVFLIATIPALVTVQTEELFDPQTNGTFFSLRYKFSLSGLHNSYFVSMCLLQFVSLIIVLILNAVLIWALKKRNKLWVSRRTGERAAANDRTSNDASERRYRTSVFCVPLKRDAPASSAAQRGTVCGIRALRERKLGRMVVMLSGIHLMSSTPTLVLAFLTLVWPDLKVVSSSSGAQCFTFEFWGFITNLEALNASVNILIYYHMSTRYRETFKRLLASCTNRSTRVAPG
ncbi:chemosensory receptor a [Plakobranchus ocellatus]|uniref:Chemosensory receptor a n=1 Tax=Plakobranchus ocellatus TaxID=259542 RepID=A0AAV3Y4E9_9GAST|nr:chemosensory receptor a [Plakobranchus ocellatus]